MANNFKRVAGSRPANTTEAKLYSPGVGKEFLGILYITNTTGSDATYRVSVNDTDAVGVLADGDFIARDATIVGNGKPHTFSIFLENPNGLYIRSGTSDSVSFNLQGDEKDV